MTNKVVTLKNRTLETPAPRAADIWHTQINLRLSQIERMIKRLEWQVWGLLCGGSAMAAILLIERLTAQ